MFTFTIHVPTWLQGESESYLLRDDCKMCCLGFYLEAAGAPRSALYMQSTPLTVPAIPESAKWLISDCRYVEEDEGPPLDDSETAAVLININDSKQGPFAWWANDETLDYYSWLLSKMCAIADVFRQEEIIVLWDGIA